MVVAGRPLFRGEPLAVYVLLWGGLSINSYVRLELSLARLQLTNRCQKRPGDHADPTPSCEGLHLLPMKRL